MYSVKIMTTGTFFSRFFVHPDGVRILLSSHCTIALLILSSIFYHGSLGHSRVPDVLGQKLPRSCHVCNPLYSPVFMLI